MDKITDWLNNLINEYLKLYHLATQSIFDLETDIRDENLQKVIFDMVGISGLILFLLSLIPQLYYLSRYKTLVGLPMFYFPFRMLGLALIFIYGYYQHNLAIGFIATIFFSFSLSAFVFYLLR